MNVGLSVGVHVSSCLCIDGDNFVINILVITTYERRYFVICPGQVTYCHPSKLPVCRVRTTMNCVRIKSS